MDKLKDEEVLNKIYFVRGAKVMLDQDLAALYGVETRVFNQSVKRNPLRFPPDFMFRLTAEEYKHLTSQIVMSSTGDSWGGRRQLPYAFTEQGVAMLSSILKSETAIRVNIAIIRVFSKMREVLLSHKELLHKLERLEHKSERHDSELKAVFAALKKLLHTPVPEVERRPVGYKASPRE